VQNYKEPPDHEDRAAQQVQQVLLVQERREPPAHRAFKEFWVPQVRQGQQDLQDQLAHQADQLVLLAQMEPPAHKGLLAQMEPPEPPEPPAHKELKEPPELQASQVQQGSQEPPV
jgi:hypothetical protein